MLQGFELLKYSRLQSAASKKGSIARQVEHLCKSLQHEHPYVMLSGYCGLEFQASSCSYMPAYAHLACNKQNHTRRTIECLYGIDHAC